MTCTPGLSKNELAIFEFNQNHSYELNEILNEKFSEKYFVSDMSMIVPSMDANCADINMIQKEVDDYLSSINWLAFKLTAELQGTGGYILRPFFNKE